MLLIKYFFLFFNLFLIFGQVFPQEYRFLPDFRVNQDSPVGTYYHSTGFVNGHSIVQMGDYLLVAWYGNQEGGGDNYQVYISRSTDQGMSFLPQMRVGNFAKAILPALTYDHFGNLYLAFTARTLPGDTMHIFCARSSDTGRTFPQITRVDAIHGDTSYAPSNPAIACGRNGEVYIVWSDLLAPPNTGARVLFAKSSDSGRTFSRPLLLSLREPPLHSSLPTMAVDGFGNIHIAWRDNRLSYPLTQYHIFYTKSTDGGNSFLPSILVDTITFTSATFPCLAVNSTGQEIYVIYKARINGTHHIYLSKSNDFGNTFQELGRVDHPDTLPSDEPNLVLLPPNRLFFTWKHGFYQATDIYFRFSPDGGNNFSEIYRVNTPSSPGVDYGQIAVDENLVVYCVWTDFRHSQSSSEIYFTKGIPEPGAIEEPVFLSFPSIAPGFPHPLRIWDVTGKVVPKGKKLQPGVYFLRINEKGEEKIKKVLLLR